MFESINIRPQCGTRPGEGQMVCLLLDGLELARLVSADPLGHWSRREGVLILDICGQAHTLDWRTDAGGQLLQPQRYRDVVLFVGLVSHGLQSTVTVLETDHAPFERFRRASGYLLEAGSGFAGLAQPYGPAAAAGSALAKAVIQYIGTRVEDDLELAFHGDLLPSASSSPSAVSGRLRFTLERNLCGAFSGPGIRLGFQVDVLPVLSSSGSVSLILEEIRFVLRERSGSGDRLIVDAGFGSGRQAQSFTMDYAMPRQSARLGSLIRVRDCCVYAGSWSGLLPYSLQAAVVPEETMAKVAPIVRAGRDVYEECLRLDESLSRAEVRDAADRFEGVGSGTQSLLSLALAFAPGKEVIGSVSGLLIMAGAQDHETEGGSVRRVHPGESFEVIAGSGSGERLLFRFRVSVS